jgi:hypothetical protein
MREEVVAGVARIEESGTGRLPKAGLSLSHHPFAVEQKI